MTLAIRRVTPIIAAWNIGMARENAKRHFGHLRRFDHSDLRDTLRRMMRHNLTCRPKGRGSKAWKRAAAPVPGTILWPDYALPRHKV